MKEFINLIEIAPAADIASITGTAVEMKSGRTVDVIYSSNDISPGEKDKQSGGNRFFTQDLKVICDKLGTILYNRYRDRKVVIKLFTDQDEEILLGSLAYPARCAATTNLTQDILMITCETPNSLVS